MTLFVRCSLLLLLPVLAYGDVPLPDKVGFNEHIRPILSNNCYYCHGPDDKHREADLHLDTREGATKDLGGYAAVVPGKPDQSELIKRIITEDEDDLMPPPKSKKPRLSKREVALVRKWVEQGAPYEGHWAFLPLRQDAPPAALKNEAWVQNPIDRFVAARLEREAIAPSQAADPQTLIRRMSLDLTGLVPTPVETEAFAKAAAVNRQQAVEQLADRLLASPHYGERWGRHWLDQARYGDSDGYSIDGYRAMWPYRDWVIQAINQDMPFDRFTIEQLAGDLLPGKTKSQLVASAFHRNTLINNEGGTDPEQFRVESCIDRVNTTGAVWLGLTVGCAQCHTHKFDPIQHKEYYQLFAFFNSGTDVNNKGATVPVTRGEMFGKAATTEDSEPKEEKQRRQAVWEKAELAKLTAQPRGEPAKWSPGEYVEYDTTSNAGFRRLDDNSLLGDGRGSFNDTYRIVVKTPLPEVAAVRLRVLTHESLPKNGPGTASNGNFVLTNFDATIGSEDLAFASATADHEQPKFPVSAAIDEDAKTGWAINSAKGPGGKMNANHEAVFVLTKPVKTNGRTLEFRLHHDLNQRYLIGRFAIDVSATVPKGHQDDALFAALQAPAGKRDADQLQLVEEAFVRSEAKEKRRRRSGDNANEVELMVMQDLPEPRPTYIFQRGDFLRPDKKVGPLQPGVIAAVSAPMKHAPATFKNRHDLAKWLVHPENPMTPRVTMNRVWMHYFGRGLVETEEDFGTQGTSPSHPELLDWLGREFIRRGWSMKAIHRLVVTSATYQQSSKARPDLAEKDPRNLLLARQERLRVEAEIIRDAALCASGLLDRTIGGPGNRPPQPDGVYAFTQTNKKWEVSTGSERYRRGMYTVFFRSAPHPSLGTFDVPDMQTTCTRRLRSNTPLQSLTLANDAAFMEIAQGFAARMFREAGDLDSRLRLGFRLSVCREPGDKELAILRDYVKGQQQQFTEDAEAARALAGKQLAQAPPAEAAALVCAARALLNTDNFITRE
jgi:hypothetical protein